MRTFNTSGPNIHTEHYTLERKALIEKGVKLVEQKRYFTIWAPRQTGKSTFFRLLGTELEKQAYQVVYVNFENFQDASKESLLRILSHEFQKGFGINMSPSEFTELFEELNNVQDKKLVLIIDEIEGLNPELFNQFLHIHNGNWFWEILGFRKKMKFRPYKLP
jgi:predicted AAA+ superfamily ATPase